MKILIGILLIALLGGCFTGCHSWPKDAYIEGAKSTINTPWGPSTQEAAVIATGTAANKASGLVNTPAR